ncbi:MAG TPA: ABC transporter ATP-binding protein [Gammaproteobacteria bacterium]|nr:ABC transporter ATP-binding protein [Gammaproteobacteria bacterium]
MKVYSVCAAPQAPIALTHGLPRKDGRQHVFEHWNDVQAVLESLAAGAETATDAAQSREELSAGSAYVVLVLEVDEDMLVRGPLPRRRAGPGMPEERLAALQSQSRFLEMDLAAQRVVGVKDATGNDVTARYRTRRPPRVPLLRFLAFVRPYLGYVVGATTVGILKFLAPLAFPWMLRVLLDDVVLDPTLSAAEKEARTSTLVLVLLGVNVLWMVSTYYRSVWAAIAGQHMIRDLRIALFEHVQRLSHGFFARNQSGGIVSRVVHDINLAQNFVGSALTNVWMDIFLIGALVIILMSIHFELALVSLALMPIYVLSVRYHGPRIQQVSREAQQRLEILSGNLQERVAGVAVVKGFTQEEAESRRFAVQADKLLTRILHSVRFTALNETLVGLVVHTSPVLVAWYGIHLIIDGRLTVGQLTQFLLYLAMFYFPLQRLADLSVVLANSLAAIERIFEYFDTQPQVAERPGARELTRVRGSLAFEQVSFGYEADLPVLHAINLTIEAGETIAFVGPSGSGKSTLANLVPRFHDPDQGRITLDGIDLRDCTLASLRRQIGIVNQETVLFSGTVEENLRIARPGASQAEIEAALDAAHALEFVHGLPEGLWTEIGERGAVLSGGQKQRLAIARAFLKDPRILILDEATSALDSVSEHRIQQALARLLEGRTSVVIAHRLSTVLSADRIIVLDQGRIVQCGTHAELIAEPGLYARLHQEQFRSVA